MEGDCGPNSGSDADDVPMAHNLPTSNNICANDPLFAKYSKDPSFVKLYDIINDGDYVSPTREEMLAEAIVLDVKTVLNELETKNKVELAGVTVRKKPHKTMKRVLTAKESKSAKKRKHNIAPIEDTDVDQWADLDRNMIENNIDVDALLQPTKDMSSMYVDMLLQGPPIVQSDNSVQGTSTHPPGDVTITSLVNYSGLVGNIPLLPFSTAISPEEYDERWQDVLELAAQDQSNRPVTPVSQNPVPGYNERDLEIQSQRSQTDKTISISAHKASNGVARCMVGADDNDTGRHTNQLQGVVSKDNNNSDAIPTDPILKSTSKRVQENKSELPINSHSIETTPKASCTSSSPDYRDPAPSIRSILKSRDTAENSKSPPMTSLKTDASSRSNIGNKLNSNRFRAFKDILKSSVKKIEDKEKQRQEKRKQERMERVKREQEQWEKQEKLRKERLEKLRKEKLALEASKKEKERNDQHGTEKINKRLQNMLNFEPVVDLVEGQNDKLILDPTTGELVKPAGSGAKLDVRKKPIRPIPILSHSSTKAVEKTNHRSPECKKTNLFVLKNRKGQRFKKNSPKKLTQSMVVEISDSDDDVVEILDDKSTSITNNAKQKNNDVHETELARKKLGEDSNDDEIGKKLDEIVKSPPNKRPSLSRTEKQRLVRILTHLEKADNSTSILTEIRQQLVDTMYTAEEVAKAVMNEIVDELASDDDEDGDVCDGTHESLAARAMRKILRGVCAELGEPYKVNDEEQLKMKKQEEEDERALFPKVSAADLKLKTTMKEDDVTKTPEKGDRENTVAKPPAIEDNDDDVILVPSPESVDDVAIISPPARPVKLASKRKLRLVKTDTVGSRSKKKPPLASGSDVTITLGGNVFRAQRVAETNHFDINMVPPPSPKPTVSLSHYPTSSMVPKHTTDVSNISIPSNVPLICNQNNVILSGVSVANLQNSYIGSINGGQIVYQQPPQPQLIQQPRVTTQVIQPITIEPRADFSHLPVIPQVELAPPPQPEFHISNVTSLSASPPKNLKKSTARKSTSGVRKADNRAPVDPHPTSPGRAISLNHAFKPRSSLVRPYAAPVKNEEEPIDIHVPNHSTVLAKRPTAKTRSARNADADYEPPGRPDDDDDFFETSESEDAEDEEEEYRPGKDLNFGRTMLTSSRKSKRKPICKTTRRVANISPKQAAANFGTVSKAVAVATRQTYPERPIYPTVQPHGSGNRHVAPNQGHDVRQRTHAITASALDRISFDSIVSNTVGYFAESINSRSVVAMPRSSHQIAVSRNASRHPPKTGGRVRLDDSDSDDVEIVSEQIARRKR